MNNRYYAIFGILLIILLGLWFIAQPTPEADIDTDSPQSNDSGVVGGDRDMYGCLTPAGFSYNSELDACVREWLIETDVQKRAIQTVIQALPTDPAGTKYSISEILVMRCPGCFTLTMELNGVRSDITIENWEIVQISNNSDGGTADTATSTEELSPETCTNMGGRVVNTVAGEACATTEYVLGSVEGFISPAICCLSKDAVTQINSFQECVDAGYPIMESYPMQCRTPDNRIFVQDISMTEKEARSTAETSMTCTNEGQVGDLETYNEGTQTWWFTLKAEKEGCSPACVVNEVTRQTEINWRCTGLNPDQD